MLQVPDLPHLRRVSPINKKTKSECIGWMLGFFIVATIFDLSYDIDLDLFIYFTFFLFSKWNSLYITANDGLIS